MKKLILLMLLSISNIYSQDSIKPIFNGIGIFKINECTTSIIKELEGTLGVETNELKTKNYEKDIREALKVSKNNFKYMGLVIEDSIDENMNHIQPVCHPKTKTYLIKGYKISDIELNTIKLIFYNDTLSEITLNKTPQLSEIIHLKYGNGLKTSETNEITCKKQYEWENVKKKETTNSEIWINNDIISCEYSAFKYNSDCSKYYINYITIYSSKIKKVISEYQKETIKKKEIQENNNKLKSIKDL